MALVFMDGFDHYNVGDIGKKWASIGPGAATMTMASGRINGQSVKQVNANNIKYLVAGLRTPTTTGGVGFALKLSAYGGSTSAAGIVSLQDGSSGLASIILTVNTDGSLSVFRRTNGNNTFTALVSGGIIPLNTWVYIEWKWVIHASAGSSTIRVNGTQVATVSGVSTVGDTNSVICTSVEFFTVLHAYGRVTFNSTGEVWLDDVYIFDSDAGVTDFLGDVTIQTRYPTANGTTNTGTASAGSNYACVDEALASTTDYVTLDAVNETETYVVEDVSAGADIKAVQVVSMVKRTTDGAAALVSEIRHAGTNYDHPTAQGVGTDYEFKTFIHETDPLDAAWTDTTFNAAEFGVKKSA